MNVSIIIPVYQVAPYIEDCLRSVMHQTYAGSMECLIVDDCGSDESIATVERMIAAYEGPVQFQILHHEQNRGLSAARNTGTMQAKGTYLYYLDSDDEMTEGCIETLMGMMMTHPELEMVQGNAVRYFPFNRSVVDVKQVSLPLAVTNEECFYQLKQMQVNVWNKLIRRDLIVDNNILCLESVLYEDNLWSFDLLKVLKHAGFISKITYHHRVRPNSIMTGTDKRTMVLNYCTIYREILTHLTPGFEQDETEYYVNIIIQYYYKYGSPLLPEFRDLLNICREQSKRYCGFWSRQRLELIYFLGKSKCGRVIWASARKVKYQVKIRNIFKKISNDNE